MAHASVAAGALHAAPVSHTEASNPGLAGPAKPSRMSRRPPTPDEQTESLAWQVCYSHGRASPRTGSSQCGASAPSCSSSPRGDWTTSSSPATLTTSTRKRRASAGMHSRLLSATLNPNPDPSYNPDPSQVCAPAPLRWTGRGARRGHRHPQVRVRVRVRIRVSVRVASAPAGQYDAVHADRPSQPVPY